MAPYEKIKDEIDGETLVVTDTITKKKTYSRRWLLEEQARIAKYLTELDNAELQEP